MIKIAINGFGRIGRAAFKRILEKHPNLEIAAINDLTDPKTLSHLLKYDSVYGIYEKAVEPGKGALVVAGKEINVLSEPEPSNLPWKKMGIDVVLESTGAFRKFEQAGAHLKAGAKRVIMSAPSKDPDKVPTFLLGVNQEKFNPEKDLICDMGSCTTNCAAPVLKVLNDELGVKKALFTTIHSYTSNQRILDLPHKDLRRARAAALNIIPTTTGAAITVERCLPELKGRLNGIAIRVPTPVVSVCDIVCELEKQASPEEINSLIGKASQTKKLKGILAIEKAPLVSSDFIGNSFSSVVDAGLTMVKDNLAKVMAWYDNEWAYACRLAEFAEYIGKRI